MPCPSPYLLLITSPLFLPLRNGCKFRLSLMRTRVIFGRTAYQAALVANPSPINPNPIPISNYNCNCQLRFSSPRFCMSPLCPLWSKRGRVYIRLKAPSPTTMSGVGLKLHIKNQQPYTTDDSVLGFVDLHVEDKLDLEALEVELVGVATSQNYAQKHDTFSTSVEKHTLLKETRRVFPPEDVQTALNSRKFTLPAGDHSYPFEFVFPGKDHIAQCVRDKKKLHRKYYLKKDKVDVSSLVGTFAYHDNIDEFCTVQYSVKARAIVPLKFGSEVVDSVDVIFVPKNADSCFSVLHLCELSLLLPNRDHTCQKVRYGFDSHNEKSRLLKLFLSNALNVPFELLVQFKEALPLLTEKGTTYRVLEGGHMLSKFVDLQLLMPLSLSQLALALGSEAASAVKISRIRVKLVLLVRFAAMSELARKVKKEILDKELDLEIPFSDFERKEYRGSELFKKLPGKLLEGLNKYYCYRTRLDPSWWDCYVHDVGQSFLTCNIKKDVNLVVYLTLASPTDPLKKVEIKSVSPVVFYRQEHSEIGAPDEAQDQLPIYTPRPPEYQGNGQEVGED